MFNCDLNCMLEYLRKKQRNIDKKSIMRGAQEAEKVKQHVDVSFSNCMVFLILDYM